ncbi:unnamed protein product [Chrysodeixis includens]|uniref:Arrestin C-terminal-like domain-containing protein n=1 Tax=Chrysodeixis includens TaxID=689277 RepID=A0A9P0BHP2_CHRIL|nr:unnamed protein product [Chrysodeixis includens]
MVVLCQILVDTPVNGAYRPGDIIDGTVKYYLDKPTRFEAINVSLIGEGLASWPVSDDSCICDKQEYVSLNKNILQAYRNPVLDQGCYSSAFTFVIPENIPSTFRHATCDITYKILVNFQTKMLYSSCKMFEIEIPVYGTISPDLPEPMTFQLKKDIFTLGPGPNEVNILVEIKRTFISSEENINLFLLVNNNSNVKITTIKTELVRYFSLVMEKSKKPFDIEPLEETKNRTDSVNKFSMVRMSCVIPTSSDLYSIQHTRRVLIEYRVRVTVKFPFPHSHMFLEIPVVIGKGDDVRMYRKIQDCY